jgi:PAS domain S-box-containing protein
MDDTAERRRGAGSPGSAEEVKARLARRLARCREIRRALGRAQSRLAHLIEVTSDMVWEVNADGVYTYVSPRVRAHLGFEPEEVIGKTPVDLLPPEDRPRFEALFREVRAKRQPVRFLENRNVRKDGSIVYLETSAVPFFERDGRLGGYRGVDRDITAHKLAEEERERALAEVETHAAELEGIFLALPDLYFRLDADGTILDYRAGSGIDLHVPPARFLHHRMQDVLPPPLGDEFGLAISQALTAHTLVTYEYPLPIDGQDRAFEARILPLRSGEVIAIVRNITQLRDVERERVRLAEQVRRERELLRQVVDNAPLPISIVAGPEHRYLLANPAHRQIAHGRGDPVGRTVAEVWPELAEQILPILDRVYHTGEPYSHRDAPFHLRRDGQVEELYSTISLVPLKDPQGAVWGILGVGIDTTAQVLARRRIEQLAAEAQERAAQLRIVFDSMVDAVFVADGAGNVTLANDAAREMMGLETAERAPLSAAELAAALHMRSRDGSPLAPSDLPLTRALAGEAVEEADLLVHSPSQGRDLYVRASAAPVQGAVGRVTGAVQVLRDITELIELDRLKDQFITMAAHELKTPIASMKGYAQILLRRQSGISSEGREMLAAIDRGATRLDHIIADLLEVSRLQLGTMTVGRDTIDLVELAREAARGPAAQSPQHRLLLPSGGAVWVRADRERVRQVLVRLIDNAIRYSPQGGDVEIEVAARDESGVLSVTDHGVGIPRERQGRVFERFYRAHAGTPYDYGGLGIALSISRDIIRRMGGDMGFRSQEGEGSTFFFSLPLAPPPEAAAQG